MSKYEALAMEVLTDKWQSTNKIRRVLEKKTKTSVNWYLLHRALTSLEREGKVELMQLERLFLWKKR